MQDSLTREDLHAQYLAARKPYKSKAEFLNSDSYTSNPSAVDTILFIAVAFSLGYLMHWSVGTDPFWGFVPAGIFLIIYTTLAQKRKWDVYSYRSWYMKRHEPILTRHQTALEALLASSVPPETLASWQHDPLRGRATYLLAGYEIIYDAVKDHFRVRDAEGPGRTYFGTYEQTFAYLRGRIMQAGLC